MIKYYPDFYLIYFLVLSRNFDNVDIVNALIRAGVNLEFQDSNNRTALMFGKSLILVSFNFFYLFIIQACHKGFDIIANALVQNMSSVAINFQDNTGRTAITYGYFINFISIMHEYNYLFILS